MVKQVMLLLVYALALFLSAAALEDEITFSTYVCESSVDKACPSSPRSVSCPTPNTCFASARLNGKIVDDAFRLITTSSMFNASTPLNEWELLQLKGNVPIVFDFVSATPEPYRGVFLAGTGILDERSVAFTPSPGRKPFVPIAGVANRIRSFSDLPDAQGRPTGHRLALFFTTMIDKFPFGVHTFTPNGELLSSDFMQTLDGVEPIAISCLTSSKWVMVAYAATSPAPESKTVLILWSQTAGRGAWKLLHSFPEPEARFQHASAAVQCLGGVGCIAASAADRLNFVFISLPATAYAAADPANIAAAAAAGIDVGANADPIIDVQSVPTGAPIIVSSVALCPSGNAGIITTTSMRDTVSGGALALYFSSEGGSLWSRDSDQTRQLHLSRHADGFTGAAFAGKSRTGLVVGVGANNTGVYTAFFPKE